MGQFSEFRFGKRGVLRAGDLFRASLGPYWMGTDDLGNKVRRTLAMPGLYRFLSYTARRKRGWITAYHLQRGQYETLYVTGPTYRFPTIPGVVNRPYRVTGVKQPQEK